MIGSDVMRGFNEMLILSLLDKEDSYGYLLSKEIAKISDNKYSMKETTLYAVNTRLEKNNYIASYEGEESFGKKRTYFTMTTKGREYYHHKLAEWEEIKKVINLFVSQNRKDD